jgi:heptaprenyl diphosphate synthase
MTTPEPLHLHASRDDRRIAALAALAIGIHVIEAALPSPLPGVKPGLANVITLVVLLQYGWRDAAWVSLLRVLAGSLLIGSFMSPTFALSLAGACASLLTLGLAWRLNPWLPGQGLGAVGFSVLAAIAHMTGQLLIARLLIIPHDGLFHLLPILMTAAVLFGIVSGIISQAILTQLRQESRIE